MNSLQAWDVDTFLWINTKATHPWADVFFSQITDLHKHPMVIGAAALILIAFGVHKYGWFFWRVMLGLAIAVSCSDMFCYRVLKANIDRPRPYDSLEVGHQARLLAEAHGNGFPSNHAANCFAAAVVFSFAFPEASYFFYIFAAIVAYSRIYVGVHFPIDVAAGALVGYIIGWLASAFTVFQLKRWSKPEN